MKPQSFNERSPGICRKTLEGYYAFFPAPRPPKLEVDWDLMALISQADQAMGELSGAGQLLPNPLLLIRPYLRREAILILDHVFANPFISIARHAERVGVSYQKAQRGVEFWIEEGLLREGTGQQRNRIYVANEILQIMAAPSLPVNAEPSPREPTHD